MIEMFSLGLSGVIGFFLLARSGRKQEKQEIRRFKKTLYSL